MVFTGEDATEAPDESVPTNDEAPLPAGEGEPPVETDWGTGS